MRKIPRFLWKLPLRTRLIASLAVIFLLLVGLGMGVYFFLESTVVTFADVVEEVMAGMVPIEHLQVSVLKASRAATDYRLTGDPARRESFLVFSRRADGEFAEMLSARSFLSADQPLVLAAREEWRQARALGEDLLRSDHAGRPGGLDDLERRFDARIRRTDQVLEELHARIHVIIDRRLTAAHRARARVPLVIFTVFGLGLGGSVLVGTMLARSVLLPLQILEEGAGRFGEGELSYRVGLAAQDELGHLASAFNTMAEKLEKSQAELQFLSIHDGLTGLYNRREFHWMLKEEIERSRRYGRSFSLLMLDIDHFKSVNDTYGHQAGDEVLRVLADLVGREVRPVDRVCRFGGEEFTIILPETPVSGGLITAERIRALAGSRAISVTEEQSLNLTVSVGVAAFPLNGKTAEDLLSAADQALYAAKRGGRNRVCAFGESSSA